MEVSASSRIRRERRGHVVTGACQPRKKFSDASSYAGCVVAGLRVVWRMLAVFTYSCDGFLCANSEHGNGLLGRSEQVLEIPSAAKAAWQIGVIRRD